MYSKQGRKVFTSCLAQDECSSTSLTRVPSPSHALRAPPLTLALVQEVQRRKAAAKEAEALKEEAAKLKQQLGAAEASVSALQAANAQARTQLQALREQQSAGAGGEQQLQAALGQRDAEVLRLQQQVSEGRTLLLAATIQHKQTANYMGTQPRVVGSMLRSGW